MASDEVVLRHQQHMGERDEVLDRELIHEPHAVGARHRHALPLERADHGRGERIAAPHQDQNVPGRDGAALRAKLFTLVDPAPDQAGDALAQRLHGARVGVLLVPRLERLYGFRLGLGLDAAHSSTTPPAPAVGVMLDDGGLVPR